MELSEQDFELITKVEWGPSVGDKEYDADQELAPRPKKFKPDPCGCPPSTTALRCHDDACILRACQEECGAECGMNCQNQRIQLQQYPPVQVIAAGAKGRGLAVMSDTTLPPGTMIAEYVGQAVRQNQLPKLFRRYQFDRRLYIMALGDGVYLDARKKGGLARFINHSCDPNCRVERWKVKGTLRAAVVAIKDLKPGEELTFDYQWERKRGRAPTKCHCGATTCRGTLEVAKSAEEEDLLKKLQGHWAKGHVAPDQMIVNRTVQIFSAQHQEYFLGGVTGFDPEKRLHRILYSHNMNEEWEDLSKEKWMILDEKIGSPFMIAKKITRPAPSNSSLLEYLAPNEIVRNYVYAQTPVKEMLWSKHLIENCERTCQVQIQAIEITRRSQTESTNGTDDVELSQALVESRDGVVWKLLITGSDIPRAITFLSKNIAHWTKKLQLEQTTSPTPHATPASSVAAPSFETVHEVIFPRQIVDAVKRKLPLLRDKCRSVNITFAPSESKCKQIARLVLDGPLLSDVQAAKDHVWAFLLGLCYELDVLMSPHTISGTPRKIPKDLGFLGGALDAEQFQLLCNNVKKNRLVIAAKEDLNGSPFITSFESAYHCTIWVQADDDMGRINSNNQIVGEATPDGYRKVFFGCAPREIPNLWARIEARTMDLRRGVKFLNLGPDRVYQPLMIQNGDFFSFVKRVTGASVSIDVMTGDHLRIDGKSLGDDVLSTDAAEMSEAERANLAEEIVRLQIELYRDHCIRQRKWIFGRDWTCASLSSVSAQVPASDSAASFGKLDRASVNQAGLEVAGVVEKLQLPRSVAAHAMLLMYRFAHAHEEFETHVKTRDALLACVYLANKTQKSTKWKGLEVVLAAGYETFYPGSKFDGSKEEVNVMEERVIAAESEILETLDYDVFWEGVDYIFDALVVSGKLTAGKVLDVFELAFSGPILSAGSELWLRYGVKYVFAVSAFMQNQDLDDILERFQLIPLKVLQAAQLIIENVTFSRASGRSTPIHPCLVDGKLGLEKHLPKIKDICLNATKSAHVSSSPTKIIIESSSAIRYKIISEKRFVCRTIKNVSPREIEEQVLPLIDSIIAESSCHIYVTANEDHTAECIVMEGSWRAVALAESLLRSRVNPNSLPPSTQSAADPMGAKLEGKVSPGFINGDDVKTIDGWKGTIQADAAPQGSESAKFGGKNCVAGRILCSALRNAGLRWWIPPKHAPSLSGALQDMFLVRSSENDLIDSLGKIAKSFIGKSDAFPLLSARMVRIINGSNNECVPVSLQRWPPEKIAAKEAHTLEKQKSKMSVGFSAAALQEMQLLIQLHSVISSPHGHPNFVLPVGIAAPAKCEVIEKPKPTNGTAGRSALDDNLSSLFSTTEENVKKCKTEKDVKDSHHLVMIPVPFVLHRFMHKRYRGTDRFQIYPTIMASWFHDLLSALVHCHSNHIVLRTIQAEAVVVDHAGTAKIAGLYRCSVAPFADRPAAFNAEKAIRLSKKKKGKDDTDDCGSNPYIPPEILLGSSRYTKESDVWSMGCLFVNLLLNKPLFVGKDRVSLLTSQYKVVGTIAKDNFEEGARFPHYFKPSKKYPRAVEKALEHLMKDKSAQYSKAIDMIASMLHLDPKERCTAEQALGHDYMVEFMENASSAGFQNQYASDWLKLKNLMVQVADDGSKRKDPEKVLKRRAEMVAATKTSDDAEGDDLYDIDELLESTSTKRHKNS